MFNHVYPNLDKSNQVKKSLNKFEKEKFKQVLTSLNKFEHVRESLNKFEWV